MYISTSPVFRVCLGLDLDKIGDDHNSGLGDHKIRSSKSRIILTCMKIRFLKDVLVDVQKARIEEMWDKQFHRWQELNVEIINWTGKNATIVTSEGDVLLDVPEGTFTQV